MKTPPLNIKLQRCEYVVSVYLFIPTDARLAVFGGDNRINHLCSNPE